MNYSLLKLGFTEDTKDRLKDLTAGAVAGAVSNLAVAPIDTVADTQRNWRTLSSATKAERAASKSALETAKLIYKERGMGGFYGGAGTKVLKVAPATALSFMLYGLAKKTLDKQAEYAMEKEEDFALRMSDTANKITKRYPK